MILDTIVDQKKREVAILRTRGLRQPGCDVDPPRGFRQALTASPEIAVIAEVKKASPSKGIISQDFNPADIGASYERGGAEAVSVLTDEKFFQGSLDYLVQVRQQIKLPVIRKDFIIHELQIHEALAFGADAVLLIAAILEQVQVKDYLQLCRELGLDVLVEVHDEAELEKTLAAGADLVGINNRDLRDFTVDLQTTARLKKFIPDDVPVVSESGIKDSDDMKMLQDHGVAAALIGESLMRSGDREAAIRLIRGR